MSLDKKIKIINRKRINDPRGWFLKVIHGDEANLPNFTGEVYIISADKNECRANHYHYIANEWFTLIKGKALMKIEDIESKERMEIVLDEKNPQTIYVPNCIAHSFQNLSDKNYILVTYTDKLYKPADTVPYKF